MSKLYLCAFQVDVDRNELTKFFSSKAEIEFWFYNLPFSVFIKTGLSVEQISKIIEAKFGPVTHLVLEMTNYFGRLPSDHWQYIE